MVEWFERRQPAQLPIFCPFESRKYPEPFWFGYSCIFCRGGGGAFAQAFSVFLRKASFQARDCPLGMESDCQSAFLIILARKTICPMW